MEIELFKVSKQGDFIVFLGAGAISKKARALEKNLSDKLDNERIKQLDFSKFSQGNYLLHINIKNKQDVYKIQKIK